MGSEVAETAPSEADRHHPRNGTEDLPFHPAADRAVGGDRGEQRGRKAGSKIGIRMVVRSRAL